MRNRIAVACFVLVFGFAAHAQTPAPQMSQDPVVIDGAAGPCSALITVTTTDGRPVYAAKVSVHLPYGFSGVRKLDLEVGTGPNGKVKFTGLPARVHRPPVQFKAVKGEFAGSFDYNPIIECNVTRTIVIK